MRNAIGLRTSIAVTVCALIATQAPTAPSTYHGPRVSLTRIADGVYATKWDDFSEGAMNSNSLVVINERDVLVVDTQGSPGAASAIIDAIGKLTNKPVRTVVNTHFHGDHLFGNQVYTARFPGVQLIGHAATRADALELDPYYLVQLADTGLPAEITSIEKALASGRGSSGVTISRAQRDYLTTERDRFLWLRRQLHTVRITPPTVDVRDSLVITSGARTVVIKHLGRGNTAGDVVVWLPHERVLATGDVLVSPMPYAAGSFVSEWITVLDSLRTLPATTIVPGHGEILHDFAYHDSVRALFSNTRRQVYAAVSAHKDLEQTRAAVNLDAERAAFTLGKASWVAAFDANYVTEAVARLWLEATGDTAFARHGLPPAVRDSSRVRVR